MFLFAREKRPRSRRSGSSRRRTTLLRLEPLEHRMMFSTTSLLSGTLATTTTTTTAAMVAPVTGTTYNLTPADSIQAVLNKARPGDVLRLAPGVYTQTINVTVSGTAAAPITIQGSVNPDGTPATILDPTKPVPAAWQPAPEIGPGVYKQKLGANAYSVGIMTLYGKQLMQIQARRMAEARGTSAYTGVDLLAKPVDGALPDVSTLPMWPSVRCLYGTMSDGTTYIRFADGTNPNTRPLRYEPDVPAVAINCQNFTTWRNLAVRGASECFRIGGTSQGNVIDSCTLQNGRDRVRIYGGNGSLPTNNVVRNCDLSLGFYAYNDFGAWTKDGSALDNHLRGRELQYVLWKFVSGYQTSNDAGIRVDLAGAGNTIVGNRISEGDLGIVTSSPGTIISGNTITAMNSAALCLDPGSAGTTVTNNQLGDSNILLRIGSCGQAGDFNRDITISNNLFYLPFGYGHHIYYHAYADGAANVAAGRSNDPGIWLTNNRFAGGYDWMSMAGAPTDRTHVIGNVMSSSMLLNTSYANIKNPKLFAEFTGNDCRWGWLWHGVQVYMGSGNLLPAYRITDPAADYVAGRADQRWPDMGETPNWAVLLT